MYSEYGITFDSAGSWSFNNDTVRNVITFGVDNSSSSQTDNRKSNFLVLGEGLTFGINESFDQRKSFILILVNQTENFA